MIVLLDQRGIDRERDRQLGHRLGLPGHGAGQSLEHREGTVETPPELIASVRASSRM